MKRFLTRLMPAVVAVSLGASVLGACGGGGFTGCAGASPVGIVERGGGGGGGGGGHAGFSGSHSSGGSSGGYSSGGSRGSGSSAGYSGARPSSGASSRSGSAGYSGARSVVNPATHAQVPSSVRRSYASHGYSFSYHPESYWMHQSLNPYNPYDTRNYTNPLSPFYRYHLAVHC